MRKLWRQRYFLTTYQEENYRELNSFLELEVLGVVYELSCLEHLKAVPPSVTHISFSLLVKLDSHLSQNREQLKEPSINYG